MTETPILILIIRNVGLWIEFHSADGVQQSS